MASALGLVVGFHIGGGAAHHHHRAAASGQRQGDVAGVVVGRELRLLVGRLMLFVDDDDARVGYGCKQRAARTHDQVGGAVPGFATTGRNAGGR